MSAILLLIAVFAAGRIEATDPCKYKMNLLFVADGSDSVCGGDLVACEGWNKTRQFMHKIAENMDIGRDASRVGLLKFGAKVTKEWDFNENHDKASLLAAIDNVERPTGELDYLGLLTAISVITQEFNVFSGDRPWITRMFVMITDGTPCVDNLANGVVATVVQLTGITNFVVCITGTSGHCDQATAEAIASDRRSPNTLTTFYANDYSSLERDKVDQSVWKQICLMLDACYVEPPSVFGFLPPIPVCNV